MNYCLTSIFGFLLIPIFARDDPVFSGVVLPKRGQNLLRNKGKSN